MKNFKIKLLIDINDHVCLGQNWKFHYTNCEIEWKRLLQKRFIVIAVVIYSK